MLRLNPVSKFCAREVPGTAFAACEAGKGNLTYSSNVF
jgi:hypothetical protein